jgi:hypothetical protein
MVARFNADGSLDTRFGSGGIRCGPVNDRPWLADFQATRRIAWRAALADLPPRRRTSMMRLRRSFAEEPG